MTRSAAPAPTASAPPKVPALESAMNRVALVMSWERFVPVIAPWGVFALLLLVAAQWSVFARLHIQAHVLILFVGLLIAFVASARALLRYRFPDRETILRRLETDSQLPTGSLLGLYDTPAAGDAGLWQLHLEQAREMAPSLRVGKAKAGIAEADPYALRYVALVLFALGLFWSGNPDLNRLREGLLPHTRMDAAQAFTVSGWNQTWAALTQPVRTGAMLRDVHTTARASGDAAMAALKAPAPSSPNPADETAAATQTHAH
ncbi:MAG: DUF4175 family protein [Asticcacaulis sp.]